MKPIITAVCTRPVFGDRAKDGAAFVLLVALALGACAADGASPAALERAERRAAPATIAPREGSGSQSPARESAPVPTEPPDRGESAVLMHDRFATASQARDAVVRGRLEEAEGPLIWLGQHAAPASMPAAFRPGVERMQRAARAAGSANTLAAAGQAIGVIAVECGACHAALRDGPAFEPSDWNDLQTASPRGALRKRMQAQLWAMERLWEGLVGPWDDAWREGCEELRDPAGHPRLPAAQQARLARVRGLAAAATAAAVPADRARIYGELLADCGSCHASLGVDPGAH